MSQAYADSPTFEVGPGDVLGITIKYHSDQRPAMAALWLTLIPKKKIELIRVSRNNLDKNLDITFDCQGKPTSITQPASDFADSPIPDGDVALGFDTIREAAETAAYLLGKN